MKKKIVPLAIRQMTKRFIKLVSQPIFIALTVFGNAVILGSASTLYYLEFGINPNIHSFLDTLWWSVSAVTTVGFGDIVPITPNGKILGIGTIIFGAALFWSYTALFAEALLSREIVDIESQLRSFSKVLSSLEKTESIEEQEIRSLLKQIQKQINQTRHLS